MALRIALATGLALALGASVASAQTTAPQATRNPVLGDPGTHPAAPPSRAARARGHDDRRAGVQTMSMIGDASGSMMRNPSL